MKKVVFASFAKFPRGDSNAIHLTNMGCIFRKLGYEVFFVGFGIDNYKDQFGTYYSIKKTKSNNVLGKVINHYNMGGKLIKKIFNGFSDADVVVMSDCFTKKEYKKIANFFEKKNNGTQLFISVTEEYTRDEFDNFNYFTKKGLKRNQFLNKEFDDRRFKMICISSYLENNFKNKGFRTMFLPFVYSNDFIGKNELVKHDGINFLYAGSPNNKDRLLDILKAFSLINPSTLKDVRLNVVGVDEHWLQSRDKLLFDKIKSFTSFHGRLEYEFIKDYYLSSDFSLILRDSSKIFSKAGCPTKVVESLFYGIPPVTNFFGDLALFLTDNFNSIISAGDSIKLFKKTIERAINTKNNLDRLKESAYNTAQSKLECSIFVNKMKDFLKNE